MKSNYHQKREARIERARERAAKAESESAARHEKARKIGDMIPFGQPILVCHHSEKRHRSDLNKIDTNMRKSIELFEKANYWRQRAAAAEDNANISSDDPDAIAKLQDKIKLLDEHQRSMKSVNFFIKSMQKKKVDMNEAAQRLMNEFGMDMKEAVELIVPDFAGRTGYPSYKLQNNNQNMARYKKRLALLEEHAAMKTEHACIGEVLVVANVDENRVQVYFPGKPDDATRQFFKQHGFRFAPSASYDCDGKLYSRAWQRQLYTCVFLFIVDQLKKMTITYGGMDGNE